jgi:hypothetical protein
LTSEADAILEVPVVPPLSSEVRAISLTRASAERICSDRSSSPAPVSRRTVFFHRARILLCCQIFILSTFQLKRSLHRLSFSIHIAVIFWTIQIASFASSLALFHSCPRITISSYVSPASGCLVADQKDPHMPFELSSCPDSQPRTAGHLCSCFSSSSYLSPCTRPSRPQQLYSQIFPAVGRPVDATAARSFAISTRPTSARIDPLRLTQTRLFFLAYRALQPHHSVTSHVRRLFRSDSPAVFLGFLISIRCPSIPLPTHQRLLF